MTRREELIEDLEFIIATSGRISKEDAARRLGYSNWEAVHQLCWRSKRLDLWKRLEGTGTGNGNNRFASSERN